MVRATLSMAILAAALRVATAQAAEPLLVLLGVEGPEEAATFEARESLGDALRVTAAKELEGRWRVGTRELFSAEQMSACAGKSAVACGRLLGAAAVMDGVVRARTDGLLLTLQLHDVGEASLRGTEQFAAGDMQGLEREAAGRLPALMRRWLKLEAAGRCPSGAVLVDGGVATIGAADGDADARPKHSVKVEPLCVDVAEVSLDRLRRCIERGACVPPTVVAGAVVAPGRPVCPDAKTPGDRPATCVSWSEADAFCRWAGGRLGTESEREWLVRGASGRSQPWGDGRASCERARFNGCGVGPGPVGERATGATPEGVRDLFGNVWEWTASDYAAYPRGEKVPEGLKVARGGSFADTAASMRASTRDAEAPLTRSPFLGLRCVYPPGK
jgi:formylglycine-generating enzyme required for sulfatase activity